MVCGLGGEEKGQGSLQKGHESVADSDAIFGRETKS